MMAYRRIDKGVVIYYNENNTLYICIMLLLRLSSCSINQLKTKNYENCTQGQTKRSSRSN